MVSYEEMVDNLKSAYAILFTATENNVGLSTDETFYCQCSVKDALSFMEEQKPMEPERREVWLGSNGAFNYEYICGSCGCGIMKNNRWQTKFCPQCGRQVKWDA